MSLKFHAIYSNDKYVLTNIRPEIDQKRGRVRDCDYDKQICVHQSRNWHTFYGNPVERFSHRDVWSYWDKLVGKYIRVYTSCIRLIINNGKGDETKNNFSLYVTLIRGFSFLLHVASFLLLDLYSFLFPLLLAVIPGIWYDITFPSQALVGIVRNSQSKRKLVTRGHFPRNCWKFQQIASASVNQNTSFPRCFDKWLCSTGFVLIMQNESTRAFVPAGSKIQILCQSINK